MVSPGLTVLSHRKGLMGSGEFHRTGPLKALESHKRFNYRHLNYSWGVYQIGEL